MIRKALLIWAFVTLALSASAQTTPTATSSVAAVINVTAFGAKGDGVTDDRPALQAAIDAWAAKEGGVLRIPKGTYLLNSYTPGAHPWGFHNLLVGSRIHIEGNRLRVRGSVAAIRFDGDYIAASIMNNDITVDTGAGIMLETGSHDACTLTRNRIAATDGSVAIHVASPSKTGKQRIEQNTISGFAQRVQRERGD